MEKILGKLLMLFHYLQLVIKTYELNTGKSKLVNCRFAFVTKVSINCNNKKFDFLCQYVIISQYALTVRVFPMGLQNISCIKN